MLPPRTRRPLPQKRLLDGKVSFIGSAMNLPFVDIEWTPEVAGAIGAMPEVDSMIETFGPSP